MLHASYSLQGLSDACVLSHMSVDAATGASFRSLRLLPVLPQLVMVSVAMPGPIAACSCIERMFACCLAMVPTSIQEKGAWIADTEHDERYAAVSAACWLLRGLLSLLHSMCACRLPGPLPFCAGACNIENSLYCAYWLC